MMRSEYRNLQRGFSLLELMVTLTIILAAMAVAVIQVMPVVRNARVDSAKQLVQDQLRTARAQAISDRGEYIVTFTTTGTITTTAPGVDAVLIRSRCHYRPMFSSICFQECQRLQMVLCLQGMRLISTRLVPREILLKFASNLTDQPLTMRGA